MDSDRAKLFVGGISRDTTEEILRLHFSKYGNVSDSTISIDRTTRIPRGFGFVTFFDLSSAHRALQDTHVILGRTVEVKKAIPRSEQQQHNHNHNHNHTQVQNRGGSYYGSYDCSSDNVRTKKIFVGGLPAALSEEEFKNYFERFGRITDVVVMQDSVTRRPRGFGFITFDSEESVQNVMMRSFHDLNGRQVEVKRAVPKDGNPGYDGFNRIRYKGERVEAKSVPQYSPKNVHPGFAPLPWYSSDGVYPYGTNAYGGWYTIGGYGGNGYAVPTDARNFWYGNMITGPQVPYATALPTFTYVGGGGGGRVGIVGSGGVPWGYNGILGSATNLKFEQPFNANGFVPGSVTSPHVVIQDVDSSSLKGGNGQNSS